MAKIHYDGDYIRQFYKNFSRNLKKTKEKAQELNSLSMEINDVLHNTEFSTEALSAVETIAKKIIVIVEQEEQRIFSYPPYLPHTYKNFSSNFKIN